MDNTELKSKMMKLWKNIFHDSDLYISLIFDNYFNPDYVEYHEEGGKFVSALLGIPYMFGNGKLRLKGLYLCGLATIEEYRHRGIMANLIKRINEKARKNGVAISFLIPASDMLRKYYSDKGYFNSMYVVEDRYTDIHNFDNDYQSILNNEDERIRKFRIRYYENLIVEKLNLFNSDKLNDVIDYIRKYEESISAYFTLLHSRKDIALLFQENTISGGDVLMCRTPENRITGVAFMTFDEHKRITVTKLFHNDNYTYFKLLDGIKRKYPDSSMSVKCYPEETDRRALWSTANGASTYRGGLPGGSSYGTTERIYNVNRHARPYGMTKILDYREILKNLAWWRGDCNFSILVKDAELENHYLKCDVTDGKASFESIHEDIADQIKIDPAITKFKTSDLSEILFRKRDSNSLIVDTLGIPRFAINMSLLLD